MYSKHKTLFQLILIGIVIMLFSSCYTQKKATDQVNKANDTYPAIVAKLARDKYPCTLLLKGDTAVIFKDTTIYVDCPDTSIATSYEVYRTDMVKNTVVKTIRVPVHLPVQVQYITRYFEDSAKLKLAAIAQDECSKENKKLQDRNETLAGRLKTRSKIMWLFVIIAIGLTVWTFRKLFI